MFKHYLTTALRHFRQYKFTTSINVVCLALGLACFMLAWSVVAYFNSYDSYHTRAARTFFITMGTAPTSKVQFPTGSTTPYVLADNLKADVPQLESVARALNGGDMPMSPMSMAERTLFGAVVFADSQFTQIFDLPFIAGDSAKALETPRSAIISAEFAEHLFGSRNVVGRTLRLAGRENITITGVIGSIGQPSHLSTSSQAILHFDVLASMDTHRALLKEQSQALDKEETTNWGYSAFYTYVVLPSDGSITPEALNARLKILSEQRVPMSSGGRLFAALPIHAMTEAGLNTIIRSDITGVSSMLMLKILGALVLLVAVINYANLATAQAAARGKEVALQRIVGASVRHVMTQYLFEAALLVGAALILSGLALVLLSFAPQLSFLAGLRVVVGHTPSFWIFIGVSAIGASVLAGAYPALILSQVKPITALRSVRVNRGSRLASLLVGLQFGSASFLIIAVLVMSAQSSHLRQAIFDPTHDPMLIIANDLTDSSINRRVLQTELAKVPGVIDVSGIAQMPWNTNMNAPGAISNSPEASTLGSVRIQHQIVDRDFFNTLNIRVLAGRVFNEASDSNSTHNVVIDRALASSLGFGSPHDALGHIIYSQKSFDASIPPDQMSVICVVENTLLKPMSFGFSSYVYEFNPHDAAIPILRLSKTNLNATLKGIDATWNRLVPNEPIKRRFADEQFEQSFSFLNILTGTFGVLAALASGIAIMGLIGMALHMIQRRTHEIGVRKTLGASVSQILVLLLRSFSTPIIIANIIAWPLAYLAMRIYVSIFAQSTGLSLLPFIASFAMTLVVAWLAVIAQATRAAKMNPATVLRYE